MQQSKEPTDPKRPEELEGPAREVALALKAWYREQAILWWRSSGRQSGTCDDGMETLNKGEGYLRPGNYLCCEGHTDDLLCRIVEWEEALQNVDRYFGPGLPDHIIRIAREKYKPNTPAQAAVTPQPSAAVHEMKRDASLQKKQWWQFWKGASQSESRQLQGLLVLTRLPLPQQATQTLIQQIVDQQRSNGHSIAPNFTTKVITAGNFLDDIAYTYASIRETFSNLGGADLMDRTKQFSFQASDGNLGKYYIVFDRP